MNSDMDCAEYSLITNGPMNKILKISRILVRVIKAN